MSKNSENVKENIPAHRLLGEIQDVTSQASQVMFNEIQNDLNKGYKWAKSHTKEDELLIGGALIVGGAALFLKDERDGARAIAEGNKILRGEQVVSQKLTFGKLGEDSSLVTKIRLGNKSEEQFWIDAKSPRGQQMLDKRDGFNGLLKK
jgi:hypothetical protein